MAFKPWIIQYSAVSVPFNTKAVDFDWVNEYMANTTNQSIWIANAWTVSTFFKTWASVNASSIVFSISDSWNNTNRIQIEARTTKFRFRIFDSSGTQFKDWSTTEVLEINTEYQIACSWNWTTFKVYIDWTEITSWISKDTDNAWTMTDTDREVWLWSWVSWWADMKAIIARWDVWNTQLSNNSMTAIYDSWSGNELDLRNSKWDYTETSNLKHQWALWKDTWTNIWADYVGSWGINISDNSWNITDADIVTY